MTALNGESVLERNPEVAHRIVDGTAVLVIPTSAKMLTLNDVGTYIWSHLEGQPIRNIVAGIEEEFNFDKTTKSDALAHALDFLTELEKRSVVRVVGENQEST